MKGYVIVDDSTNMINSVVSWGDDDISPDYPIPTGCSLVPVDGNQFKDLQKRFLNIGAVKLVDKTSLTFEDLPNIRAKETEIAELKNFLSSTDFYYIRFQETQKPIPADIRERRIAARQRLQELGL